MTSQANSHLHCPCNKSCPANQAIGLPLSEEMQGDICGVLASRGSNRGYCVYGNTKQPNLVLPQVSGTAHISPKRRDRHVQSMLCLRIQGKDEGLLECPWPNSRMAETKSLK